MARMLEGYTVTSAKKVSKTAREITPKQALKESQDAFTANAQKNGAAQRAAQEKVTKSTPLLARDATPTSGAVNDGKVVNQISQALNKLTGSGSGSSSSGGRSGSGGGGSGGGGAAAAQDPYERILQMIRETTQANNEWSAQQAQKQMDFQERMSSTAHVREVADLQAAGLNPVLSAGGSGASTPSGAMADTDNSNTRLLAEVAMASIGAMASTASGVAGIAKKATGKDNSFLGQLTSVYANNKLAKKIIDTTLGVGSKVASYAISRKLVSTVAKAAVKAAL